MSEREPDAREPESPPVAGPEAEVEAAEEAAESEGMPPVTPPAAPTRPPPPTPTPTPAPRPRGLLDAIADRADEPVEISRRALVARSRRDFLLFAAGVVASAAGAWWLLPDSTRSRLLPGVARQRLDTLGARVGLSGEARERTLDRVLTFDDDVAEALYSKDRRVRTYDRSDVTPLRNNYAGRTPGPEYVASWTLALSGLASGRSERLTIDDLMGRLPRREQVTRLICVEGWSAIAWWGGIRFADLLKAYPPAPGMRWAALRSGVNLDFHGRPDPYYVSIDLETARHPQTLLATHLDGQPLPVAHGAPLRLLVPMKLGLKNIKVVTEIAYTATEPPDYWNESGYSRYDGL